MTEMPCCWSMYPAYKPAIPPPTIPTVPEKFLSGNGNFEQEVRAEMDIRRPGIPKPTKRRTSCRVYNLLFSEFSMVEIANMRRKEIARADVNKKKRM